MLQDAFIKAVPLIEFIISYLLKQDQLNKTIIVFHCSEISFLWNEGDLSTDQDNCDDDFVSMTFIMNLLIRLIQYLCSQHS